MLAPFLVTLFAIKVVALPSVSYLKTAVSSASGSEKPGKVNCRVEPTSIWRSPNTVWNIGGPVLIGTWGSGVTVILTTKYEVFTYPFSTSVPAKDTL